MSNNQAKVCIPLPEGLREAVFVRRHNRFVGEVEMGGERVLAHVPSSGRMAELLYPGAPVHIAPAGSPEARLGCRILLAENNGCRVSVDSFLPNRLILRALSAGLLPELSGYTLIKREASYGQGRFDFFLGGGEEPGCYLEVKSVTLVVDGVALFPDAPSERGSRHMKELAAARREGFRAVVLFVIQRPDGLSLRPHTIRDPHFSRELSRAASEGVEALARRCLVSTEEVALDQQVPVFL